MIKGLTNITFRTLMLTVFSIGLLFTSSALAQQPNDGWTGPKMRIAVMDLSGSALKLQTVYQPNAPSTTIALPPPSDFARGLTEMLTTALVRTGRFTVLERAAIQQVMGEQELGANGQVNPETAAAKGKIIGAQVLVTGDITEFAYNQSSVGGTTINVLNILKKAKVDRVTAMVAIDIRLIDAVTGEVIFSQRAKGNASMTEAGADLTIKNQSFNASGFINTPLGKASREALEGTVAAITSGMKRVVWSGRIIDVREGLVYINAGSETGIQPGMHLEVYEQQEALVDPETGKTLGMPDRKIGAITVTAVQDKYSVAQVTASDMFKRNQVVRFEGQTPRLSMK